MRRSKSESNFTKLFSEIVVMRMLTKESLQRVWKNSLTSDWLPHGKARRFPHKEFYVNLKCSIDVKTAMATHRETLTDIYEVLKVSETGAVNILIKGTRILQFSEHPVLGISDSKMKL